MQNDLNKKRQKRQKLIKAMKREAKKKPAEEGRNYLEKYCCGVLTNEIIACQKIISICAILLHKIRYHDKYYPYIFDMKEANRHIDFIEKFCKQPQGRIGEPFKLELFQKARLQAIFGFRNVETSARQFTECMIVEGRKNGKTSEIAAIELDLLLNDGEGAPEIYNIATKREQAIKAFNACLNMRLQSEALKKVLKKRQSDLYFPGNMGFITALASSTNKLDGLNAHGILIDELGAIKNRAIYDDMKQSMSARSQPLLFSISTNNFIREGIFDSQYEYARGVIDGDIEDDTFLPFIYELDEREEYKKEKMWIKANPGLGSVKKIEFLRQMVSKAKQDPSFLPTVLTKDFNLIENSATSWLTWAEISNPKRFNIKFNYCVGGFDAADSVDLFAATALCVRPNDNKIYRYSMYWLPQNVLDMAAIHGDRKERDNMPYTLWIKRGLMRAYPGHKVDKRVALEWFKELREDGLYTLYIGYDRWHVDDTLLAEFKAEFGERSMIPIIQGKKTLSQPMHDLKADLRAGLIVDNNNPIDKMCLMNTAVDMDINGNIQPVKTLDARKRIDGTIALICAYKVLQDKKDEIVKLNEGATDGTI